MYAEYCNNCGNWKYVGRDSTQTTCTCRGRLICNDCGEYGHSNCRKGRWPDKPEDNPSICLDGTD